MINNESIDPNLILNLTIDEYLDSIGNVLIIDILYMYVNTTVTILGTLLSGICIWIFFNKEFDQSFYLYYKILSINSFIHEFLGFWYSICYSPRFVPFKYQHACVDYGNTFVAIHFFCFFYSGLIEVGILLDRIKIFTQRFKIIDRLDPKKMLIISFSFSLLIGILSLFIYKTTGLIWYNYEYDYINSTLILKQKSIYFFDSSDFAKSEIGEVYVDVLSFILNVPLLVIIVILNIILVYLMRKHYRESLNKFTIQPTQREKKEKAKRKISFMAIYLCSISIISRTIVLTDLIVFKLGTDYISLILIAFSDLFIFINSGCLFFVCFSFNKIFKGKLLGILKIQTNQEISRNIF